MKKFGFISSLVAMSFLLICGLFTSCESTSIEDIEDRISVMEEILEDFDNVDEDMFTKKSLEKVQKNKQKLEKKLEKEQKRLEAAKEKLAKKQN